MSDKRIEKDSLGNVEVPSDKYWGAQTQRSLHHFSIGEDIMPIDMIHAMAIVKKAAAQANGQLGILDQNKADLISRIADEIINGELDDHFPLHVWMTGSATQSNMNVNEVIANRASEIAGEKPGSKSPLHPNDHVNMSQSSNDSIPTGMYIATALLIQRKLIPAVKYMQTELAKKAEKWKDIVKIGRTHMQDAVPLTLGQEFSGYAAMMEANLTRLNNVMEEVYPLTLGGTALGSGLNAPERFSELAIANIANITGLPFVPVNNKFAAQGSHDALVMVGGVLKTLAGSLYKIADDIRLLSCGPRAGFAEILLPENEPGSSIMPGKVNPTQCEAMTMVGSQVIASDLAIAMGGSGGLLEMNAYKPLMIFNIVQSIKMMSDSMNNFTKFLIIGAQANQTKINHYLKQSLMLVTALSPEIGYEKASKLAHYAYEKDISLEEANEQLQYVSAAEFKRIVDPSKMV